MECRDEYLTGGIVVIADASDGAEVTRVSGGFEGVLLSAPYVEAVLANGLEVGRFYAMAIGSYLEGCPTPRHQRPRTILRPMVRCTGEGFLVLGKF